MHYLRRWNPYHLMPLAWRRASLAAEALGALVQRLGQHGVIETYGLPLLVETLEAQCESRWQRLGLNKETCLRLAAQKLGFSDVNTLRVAAAQDIDPELAQEKAREEQQAETRSRRLMAEMLAEVKRVYAEDYISVGDHRFLKAKDLPPNWEKEGTLDLALTNLGEAVHKLLVDEELSDLLTPRAHAREYEEYSRTSDLPLDYDDTPRQDYEYEYTDTTAVPDYDQEDLEEYLEEVSKLLSVARTLKQQGRNVIKHVKALKKLQRELRKALLR